MSFRTFAPSFILIPINILIFLSLDLRTPLKILVSLISLQPSGVSPNHFWVLEMLCALASPPIFMAIAQLMLPQVNTSS